MADTTPQAAAAPKLTIKDFQSIRTSGGAPGAGLLDLAQVQRVFPEFTHLKENYVAVSGSGCSSRFPYYMDIYGITAIHAARRQSPPGEARESRPGRLVATGDGDASASAGTNMIHMLRRNINIKVLLFNNQIYGLTKGKYSPTFGAGQITKSTPHGVIDYPVRSRVPRPRAGANARGPARWTGTEASPGSHPPRPSSITGRPFIEIYQKLQRVNDGAFFPVPPRRTPGRQRGLHGTSEAACLREGAEKGIRLNGFTPEAVSIKEDRTRSATSWSTTRTTSRWRSFWPT